MTESLFFIGAGAAGGSLAVSLYRAGSPVEGIIEPDPRTQSRINRALSTDLCRREYGDIEKASVVFLAVPDPHIEAAAQAYAPHAGRHQTWFHLSGALSTAALHPVIESVGNVGAFHPAQVFPPQQITPIPAGTHFGVSGSPGAVEVARRLVRRLDSILVEIPDAARPLYHAASVMASNAVVGLVAAARDLLVAEGVSEVEAESLLVRLAGTAIRSAQTLGLDDALSGPIQRGDEMMVIRHLDALAPHPDEARLYRVVGEAIARLAEKSGRTRREQLRAILSRLKT